MENKEKKVIRVGSRKSELALIQTNFVIDSLKKVYDDLEFTIVTMTTLGDRILNVSLPKIGEKSLFTKDLEDALRNDSVDFVVHSLKDLPTSLPDGLAIGAVFEREDPRDALVLREEFKNETLATLPAGSIVGTSSLRRTAQIRGSYPHLEVQDVRGNLNTRLRKLDEDNGTKYAALLLAKSGMVRMNWEDRISRVLPCAEIMYAVGQGALAVECRSDNDELLQILAPFNHVETYCRVLAERSFLKTLGGGCSAPVGVSTTIKPNETEYKLSISGAVWSLDGKTKVHHRLEQIFKQIKNSLKHQLSPAKESCSKKVKLDNPDINVNLIDNQTVENKSEDTGNTDSTTKQVVLQSGSKIFCGMSENYNMPTDVIEKCEDLGINLAKELISKGALEVMKVTQDYIRSSAGIVES